MSISLSNHEDRIKTLENRSIYEMSKTVLWSGKSYDNGLVVNLSQSYTDFDMLLMTAEANGLYLNHKYYDTSLMKVGNIFSHVDEALGSFVINSTTKFTFQDQADIGIMNIIGLKLYYNFSYNIYCLIYAFLK